MNEQETLDYARIAQAIGSIRENFKRQPGLDEIAREVALSTAHFQRMFTEWAGVSPKKFLQYTSIEYAKKILDETHASLFDTAQETGLSGTGRLYDLFVNIEGMTPGEYKNGGENLSINYSFAKSPFGELFIASTNKGICCLEFADDHDAAFHSLLKKFPYVVMVIKTRLAVQLCIVAITIPVDARKSIVHGTIHPFLRPFAELYPSLDPASLLKRSVLSSMAETV